MTWLYLLRHGLAIPPGTPGFEDDERPLTPKGERRVGQVGRALSQLGVKLDRVYTSPLPRARRTAEIVAAALRAGDRLEEADVLRQGVAAESIRDWLQTRTEDRLMIVGHDPGLSDLVGLLLTGHGGPPVCQLAKGGVAAFAAGDDGRLRLDWLLRPRVVRRLSESAR